MCATDEIGAVMSWKEHSIAFPEIPYIKHEYAKVYTLGSLLNTTVENIPTEDLVELVSDLVREIATRKYKETHDC